MRTKGYEVLAELKQPTLILELLVSEFYLSSSISLASFLSRLPDVLVAPGMILGRGKNSRLYSFRVDERGLGGYG
jgi:hypothetical protein